MTPELDAVLLARLQDLGYPDPDPERLKSLLESAALRSFRPGEMVIHQGDATLDVFIVHQGKLAVTRSQLETRQVEVATLGPGAIVGEMALLTGKSRSATVTALEACEVFVLPPEGFKLLLDSSPDFRRKMTELARARG